MKSFCIPLLLWVLLKVYPLLCNYNTEDPLGWKKIGKNIGSSRTLWKKNTYRKQTSLFARGIIIWGSIWIDLLKEKYSLPLSLSLIPKPEKLWKQTEHRLWAESKPILRQENQKEKKKGIICLLWCEGLRVAVWIQGNGLIIPFELIAKTGNFFFQCWLCVFISFL